MIGSVHVVIWQAGTNWAGPVRIQIYYGPEWLSVWGCRLWSVLGVWLCWEFPNGVRQVCGYQYFCHEILFYLVSSYSQFFRISLIKIYTNANYPRELTLEFLSTILFKISGFVKRNYCTVFIYRNFSFTMGTIDYLAFN